VITREQAADLREGDVVEATHEDWPAGTIVRGPLYLDGETLQVGRIIVRHWDARPPFDTGLTLTVISRAPRPLYVNHPRTEPVHGDIVRDCDGDAWCFQRDEWWCASEDARGDDHPDALPITSYRPLTLLWDGETGRVVP
jgi:hypothetical protein